jgi:hypothetical protein
MHFLLQGISSEEALRRQKKNIDSTKPNNNFFTKTRNKIIVRAVYLLAFFILAVYSYEFRINYQNFIGDINTVM